MSSSDCLASAENAQSAVEAHVLELGEALSVALVAIKGETDNPVVGAHCSCKLDEQDLPPDYNDCLGFCDEREDWADAQRKERFIELLDAPLKALLRKAGSGPQAVQVYRGALAGVDKLIANKSFADHGDGLLLDLDMVDKYVEKYGSGPDGLIPELREFLLESDQLEEEADAEHEASRVRRQAFTQKVHNEVERHFRAGTLQKLPLESYAGQIDLKDFCEDHGLKKSGKKDVIVARIAAYFGDSAEGAAQRQRHASKQAEAARNEQRAKDRRAREKQMELREKQTELREKQMELEMKVGYCCDTPEFDYNRAPAAMITFANGDVGECWRCLNCGTIPPRPNAKGAHMSEFSDSDGDSDSGISRDSKGGVWY